MEGVIELLRAKSKDGPGKNKWIPSTQDRKLLQAEGTDVWDFIFDMLQAKRVSEDSVSERKARVSSEIESLRNAVTLLQSDLKLFQETASKLVDKTDNIEQEKRLLLQRRELLRVQTEQVLENSRAVVDYARRMEEKCKYFSSKGKKGAHQSASTDSMYMKKLRSVFSKVISLLEMSSNASPSVEDFKRAKVSTMTSIESLLLEVPVEGILNEISQLAVNATQSIVKMASDVHSINDIHNLKFTVKDGILEDVNGDSSVLQSVEEHISEAELQYISISQTCLGFRKEANEESLKYESLLTECAQLVNERNTDNSKRLLIDQCLCLEIDIAVYESSVETITSITQDLLKAQSQNETNATLLTSKAERLVENDMLVASKEDTIRRIVSQNSAAKTGTQKQKAEHREYIVKKVCSSRNDIEGALSFLVTGEGRVTEKIPLSLLSKTIRTCDWKVGQFLSPNIVRDLMVHSYQIPYHEFIWRVFLFLTKMKEKQEFEHAECTHDELNSDNTVLALSQESYEKQAKLVTKLSGSLSTVSTSLACVPETERILKEMWTQPAQDIISWATVEGMTMKEWLGQWNLLMQRHNQLMNHS